MKVSHTRKDVIRRVRNKSKHIALYCGDCLEILPTLDATSLDSCVTDAPYHLTSISGGKSNMHKKKPGVNPQAKQFVRLAKGFMGKEWDGGDIAFRPDVWREVYRVLKPGAHLLAFGGTRTYHRLVCAIEDAGFEIRDQIQWLYGQGFPKSHNVGKGIEKINVGGKANLKVIGTRPGLNNEDGTSGFAYSQEYVPGVSIGGKQVNGEIPIYEITNEWGGWGTALKPACEPIVLARKPLSESTVAANVLKWGTGALNIDGCRVETNGEDLSIAREEKALDTRNQGWGFKAISRGNEGRWPANVIHDGSDEVLALFPDAGNAWTKDYGVEDYQGRQYKGGVFGGGGYIGNTTYCDDGSAARFFYCAKADSNERNGRNHPTVKPLALMRHLVKLITPPNGIVLDPFAGTGTTGQAALEESFRAVLIEKEAEYIADITRRIDNIPANLKDFMQPSEGTQTVPENQQEQVSNDNAVDWKSVFKAMNI